MRITNQKIRKVKKFDNSKISEYNARSNNSSALTNKNPSF